MRGYIVRRVLLTILTLFMVSIIVFLSVRFIPGNLVDIIMAGAGGSGAAAGTFDCEELERMYGLDVPIHTQYVRWVTDIVLHGELGYTMRGHRSVTEEILQRLPISLELAVLGMLIALVIAIPIGIYSGIRQDTVGHFMASSFSILCIALSHFWVGTMVIIYPALWWGWSPPVMYVDFIENPAENLRLMIIPAVILGMVLSGVTMRMTRSMVLEVLRQDYIRTAWAKGLRERVVVIRHVLKNALIPVITIVGLQFPFLIGGAVIIERIFNLPGLGRYLLESVSQREYFAVSGINMVVAVMVLALNLVVDLSYAYLDPRVRYQ